MKKTSIYAGYGVDSLWSKFKTQGVSYEEIEAINRENVLALFTKIVK